MARAIADRHTAGAARPEQALPGRRALEEGLACRGRRLRDESPRA